MSRIWRKQEVCDLASPCECGRESIINEIIHKINRRRKSDICSINTERDEEQEGLVMVASWPVTPLRMGRTWLLDMTLPASHTAVFFSAALATRSVWLEQISSLTPAFWTTHLLCLCQSQRGQLADIGALFLLNPSFCCVVNEHGRWAAQVIWHKSSLLKH